MVFKKYHFSRVQLVLEEVPLWARELQTPCSTMTAQSIRRYMKRENETPNYSIRMETLSNAALNHREVLKGRSCCPRSPSLFKYGAHCTHETVNYPGRSPQRHSYMQHRKGVNGTERNENTRCCCFRCINERTGCVKEL
jgi:hypothetical protein